MRQRGVYSRLAIAFLGATCALAHGVTIDFESVRPGTQWGSETGQQPGDPALAEAGIMVTVETFFLDPSETVFFRAQVPDTNDRFALAFPTQELTLDSISVLFDLSAIGFDVDFVSFDFVDFGGTTNISVNGGALHILDPLSGLPSSLVHGVTATVIDGSRIELVSLGTSITSFLVGGQELVIDNVTAVPEPATSLLLLVGTVLLAARRRRTAS